MIRKKKREGCRLQNFRRLKLVKLHENIGGQYGIQYREAVKQFIHDLLSLEINVEFGKYSIHNMQISNFK
ncbi:unnamed protein product [Paramecium octaurelia]|uniref:Uncharacterized protein n=1 Tax=Paramecium octaurelia TaxID=43137 RepID=A0A8S1VTM6_PAROT|nr:unnamed protein product [Paramecium octaurelia]